MTLAIYEWNNIPIIFFEVRGILLIVALNLSYPYQILKGGISNATTTK